MNTLVAPPTLKTLHTPPTWHNRAGRVDRSACFVLTAAQLWRSIPDQDWRYTHAARQRAHTAAGKTDRYTQLTLTARRLWVLHKYEPPHRLQGDHRTTKANAMQALGPRPEARGLSQRSPQASGHQPQPCPNPNRGVGFSMGLKILGLDSLWETTLRLERVVQHANLRQHFLACPVPQT